MSENRKCVNCRHRILKGSSSYCEISGHFLHYSTVFEHWCKHWAKDNKLFVCPDQAEELEAKSVDLENTELAKSFEQELREHNEYCEKMRQMLYDKLGIPQETFKSTDNAGIYLARDMQIPLIIEKNQKIWQENLEMLQDGILGDVNSPKTLLRYWKLQAEAHYPSAKENVRYFEDMVRKESGNAEI